MIRNIPHYLAVGWKTTFIVVYGRFNVWKWPLFYNTGSTVVYRVAVGKYGPVGRVTFRMTFRVDPINVVVRPYFRVYK